MHRFRFSAVLQNGFESGRKTRLKTEGYGQPTGWPLRRTVRNRKIFYILITTRTRRKSLFLIPSVPEQRASVFTSEFRPETRNVRFFFPPSVGERREYDTGVPSGFFACEDPAPGWIKFNNVISVSPFPRFTSPATNWFHSCTLSGGEGEGNRSAISRRLFF